MASEERKRRLRWVGNGIVPSIVAPEPPGFSDPGRLFGTASLGNCRREKSQDLQFFVVDLHQMPYTNTTLYLICYTGNGR
jgi:hypothetical protein